MRFFPQMLDVAADLSERGVIVLAPFRVVPDTEQGSDVKARLDQLHLRKIALCDRVVVVTDESHYIGASTRAEIAYATENGKPISWAVRGTAALNAGGAR
ncbi:hypothetical protein [Nocardia sp. NPDC059228]|uniref:hypothetical protein n=1 Tax=Nocardia sp. NPDC059228 TaxID=3346777 RepID=UPI0036767EA7